MEQAELCYLTGRCWAEIDLDAFCHNFEQIQHNAGKASVCAVIKADAYGHGDLVVANLLDRPTGASRVGRSGKGVRIGLRKKSCAECEEAL